MRHRCEHEIINDLLLGIKDRQLPTPLNLVFEWAKVLQDQTQQKYFDILVDCKFVRVLGYGRKTKLEITERGIQFLIFFEAIEKLMRGLIDVTIYKSKH